MMEGLRRNLTRQPLGRRFGIVLAAACFALPASYGSAEPQPTPGGNKATDKAKPPAAKTKAGPKTPQGTSGQAVPKPAAQPKKSAKSGGCGSASSKAHTKPNLDSAARWACDKQTITLAPVWTGEMMTFTFEIRNQGTAALKIKAKGG